MIQDLQKSYDIIAIGSGAGGMLSAIRAHDLGLSAIVIEKSPLYGGTSAVSGGEFWIPGNHLMRDHDPDDLVEAYLTDISEGQITAEFLSQYLRSGQALVHYLEEIGIHPNANVGKPDYISHHPGAIGGRSLTLPPVDGKKLLGENFFQMREASPFFTLLGRYALTAEEGGLLAFRLPGWRRTLLRLMVNYWRDIGWRRRTRRDRRLTLGGALVGRLRRAMLDRSIPLLLNTELIELTRSNGIATGGHFRHLGQDLTLTANCGVIIATGGFEHNQQMRDAYLPVPTQTQWSMAPGTNTGDGIRAGVAIGAGTDLLDQAHWWPTTLLPNGSPNSLTTHFVFRYPHSIIVNRHGERFLNESCSYDRFGQLMIEDHRKTGASVPAWIVFDADCRRDYLNGGLIPGRFRPDSRLPAEWWDTYVFRADTITELAAKMNVEAAALNASIDRLNGFAVTGNDLDFGRGDHPYDRILGGGDPAVKPNPCLAPVARAPFYAMRVYLGDLGTRGGLMTNPDAQVLEPDGTPIPQLYATGNTATNVFRVCYPGPGATLGPAMTFAFAAVNHAAAVAHFLKAAE